MPPEAGDETQPERRHDLRGRKQSAVGRVVGQIRQMLRSQELVPGQPLRQEALAERLGVSRVPVREALKALESEGVLRHEPHIGYAVTRLSAAELRQAYLMRAALEAVAVRELPSLDASTITELTRINDRIAEAATDADITRLIELNHEFHFTIFRACGQHMIVDEIERVWKMTEAYRSVYLYDERARKRIVREHRRMIQNLRRGDTEGIVRLMDEHREGTQAHLAPALAGTTPAADASGG